MHLTDLLGLLQQIEMALVALFQSTTTLLKALAGLLATALVVWTAYVQLRDHIWKKRRSSRGKKATPKQNKSANAASTRTRAETVRPKPQIPSVSDSQTETHSDSGASLAPSTSKGIVQMPLANLQAPAASHTQTPHVQPALSRRGDGDSGGGNVDISQPEVDGASTTPSAHPTLRNRPVRRVEFVDTFPWHADHPDRKATANALTAASNLVKIALEMQDAAHQQTRSLKIFAKQLRFVLSLSDALSKLHKHVEPVL